MANIGDGALGRGPVLEALNMSGMGQLNTLWEEGMRGGLPVLFNIFNNQYGMGGQTSGETMAYDILARMGAGFNPNQMHAERVDGFNPLAVIEAYSRKKKLLLEGKGPVLLDVVTYRFLRPQPVGQLLLPAPRKRSLPGSAGPDHRVPQAADRGRLATEEDCDNIIKTVDDAIFRNFKLAIDEEISPRMDLNKNPDEIADMMFTNGHVEAFSDAKPDVNMPMEENPRVQAIARKERWGFDAMASPSPRTRSTSCATACSRPSSTASIRTLPSSPTVRTCATGAARSLCTVD